MDISSHQKELWKYYEEIYTEIFILGTPINDIIKKTVESTIDNSRAQEKLDLMKKQIKDLVENKRILEIGSGCGMFLSSCTESRLKSFGIEPDNIPIRYSKHLLKEKGYPLTISKGVGEDLPFKENSFDVVASFQVLEHTRIPKKVLHEAVRVLKPGGYLYFVIPNYNSFWEGHYGVMWLPFLAKSKLLAKLYAKALGLNTKFIDIINFITPKSILQNLKDSPLKIISMGKEIWEQRMHALEFSSWGTTENLLFWVRLINKFKIISLAITLGRKFDLYYPIILFGQKKPC